MYDRRQSTDSQYNWLIRVSWFIHLNRYISATSNKMKHINIYSIELRLTFANVWDHSPPDRGHWLLHYMGDLRHYSQNPYLAKAKLVNGIFGIPFQSASHKTAPMFSTNNIISSGKIVLTKDCIHLWVGKPRTNINLAYSITELQDMRPFRSRTCAIKISDIST